jgi:hypothetical protein
MTMIITDDDGYIHVPTCPSTFLPSAVSMSEPISGFSAAADG